MKKGIIIISIIALLVGGWSAAWVMIADRVETQLASTKDRLARTGRKFECNDQSVGGYPFRISVDCSTLSFEDSTRGMRVMTSGLRSAAQAYQPGKIVAELSSPGRLETAQFGIVDMMWSSARSSLGASFSGVENMSFHAKDLVLAPIGRTQSTIGDLEYHDRKFGDNDFQIAVAALEVADNLVNETGLGNFDLRGEATLNDIFSNISRTRNIRQVALQRGLEGDLARAEIAFDSGLRMKLSGPLSVTSDGRLTADLTTEITEFDTLVSVLKANRPQDAKRIDQAAGAIKLLAPENSNGVRTIRLSIKRGVVVVGLIPVWQLPKLF